MVQLDKNDTPVALGDLITHRISESSCYRITFAEYMELALYHPQYGYYASSRTKFGAAGDFVTSPYLGADFGEMLAEQFVQMWHLLDQPIPFSLVEMGAGQGLLAADILGYLSRCYPELTRHLNYWIVERATALIEEQQRQLRSLQQQGLSIQWCGLEDLPPESITGCFFSNELVDALPVHQIQVVDGQLQEVYVSLATGKDAETGENGHPAPPPESLEQPWVEVIGELSTPRLADYFDLVSVDLGSPRYPEGYRTEVNLAALDWLAEVAKRLQRGYVLTIDYGYSSDRYYNPARSQGTLQCYYRHAHHSNPYLYPGQQDITAHVDFTALQKQGERCGLKTLGLTKQGLFLMSLGLGERIAALSQSDATDPRSITETLQRRDALHSLVNPMGLGGFGVLLQARGMEPQTLPLQGLMGEVL